MTAPALAPLWIDTVDVPVEIVKESTAPPAVSAAVDAPLWTFHLGGQHNQQSHGGGGTVGPDLDGNYQEDGVWLDADGNRLTDSYVTDYGKPVTSYSVEDHSLVLSQRGEYHIIRNRADPTEPDSLVREPRDVEARGLSQSEVRTIGDDAGSMIENEALQGEVRDTAAGMTLKVTGSSAEWGLQLSDGGSFSVESNGSDLFSAFDAMADAFDDYDVGTRGVEASALWQFGDTNPTVFHLPGKHDQSTHGKAGFGEGALHGDAALSSAALTVSPTAGQATALGRMGGDGAYVVNSDLRKNDGITTTERNAGTVEEMDALMDSSPLASDTVVYRRAQVRDVFGDDVEKVGDLTGMTWHDHAFVSTSTEPRPALSGSANMRILAPAGTPGFSHPEFDPDEILLDRGLTFEVVADHRGEDVGGSVDVLVHP